MRLNMGAALQDYQPKKMTSCLQTLRRLFILVSLDIPQHIG